MGVNAFLVREDHTENTTKTISWCAPTDYVLITVMSYKNYPEYIYILLKRVLYLCSFHGPDIYFVWGRYT